MTGICDRIKVAPSKAVIDALIMEAAGFKYASAVTRRRWVTLAKRRLGELENPKQAEKNSKKVSK